MVTSKAARVTGEGQPAAKPLAPNGCKQTEVGVIPEDWEFSALRNCCSKITDGTHDTPKPVRSGVPFLTAIHVKDNWIDYESCLYVTKEDHAVIFRRCNPENNDVLMVNIGAGVATTALVNVDFEFSLKNVALLKPDPRKAVGAYLNYSLARRKPKIIQDLSSGGAQPFLSLTQIGEIEIPLPPTKAEQEAIAKALGDADVLIELLEQLIAKKRQIKQGTMQELLTGKKRLPGFSGEWGNVPLRDLLSYERPDKYIVKDTEYYERGDVPVLTANKSFVLGYTVESFGICSNLPTIVFDDFTTASKYVDFPFKVKSSAIKLLRPKHDRVDLKFVFDRMQLIHFPLGDHKRYYISEFQNLEVAAADHTEQQSIAAVLSDIDAEIVALEAKLNKAQQIKLGMMQELLTGKVRLV